MARQSPPCPHRADRYLVRLIATHTVAGSVVGAAGCRRYLGKARTGVERLRNAPGAGRGSLAGTHPRLGQTRRRTGQPGCLRLPAMIGPRSSAVTARRYGRLTGTEAGRAGGRYKRCRWETLGPGAAVSRLDSLSEASILQPTTMSAC